MAERPGVPGERGSGSEQARRKAAAFRAAEAQRLQRRRISRWAASLIGAAAVVVFVLIAALRGGSHPTHPTATATHSDAAAATLTGPTGPEGIVLEDGTLLAPVAGAASGGTVDGVQCNSNEQTVYHIHTHVTVYVDGALRPIPAGIGVVQPVAQQSANGSFVGASKCYYWLHTHAQDGIIHVEAPSTASYTLGQFFAIWQQPLNASQVGPASGTVTAYVDGKRYTGDPATITLGSREDIQLDVGTSAPPPQKVDWSHSQL